MTKQITKPKQAASPRALDRWQNTVVRIQGAMADEDHPQVRKLLASLLLSMRLAERR